MIWIITPFQTRWAGGIRNSLYSLQSSSVDASSYSDEPAGVLSRQVAGGANWCRWWRTWLEKKLPTEEQPGVCWSSFDIGRRRVSRACWCVFQTSFWIDNSGKPVGIGESIYQFSSYICNLDAKKWRTSTRISVLSISWKCVLAYVVACARWKFHWPEMGRIYPHDCILQIHDATLPEEVQGAGDIRQQLTAVGHISNWPERWLLLLATRKAKADQPSCGAYILIGWPLSGIFTYPLQPTEPIVMFLKKQLNSYLTNPFPQV